MVESLESALENLYKTVESKKNADPSTSYTAQLYEKGLSQIASKVGEEAVETAIAALTQPDNVVDESADLLYHLLVLWAELNITPERVWRELQDRQGVSGIEEKSSREIEFGDTDV